jgi:hypothetical protein
MKRRLKTQKFLFNRKPKDKDKNSKSEDDIKTDKSESNDKSSKKERIMKFFLKFIQSIVFCIS